MKKSTKIILVISIISILSFIMIIPSFAVNYPTSITIESGTILTFKNVINMIPKQINIDFTFGHPQTFNKIYYYSNNNSNFMAYNTISDSYLQSAYNYSTNTWGTNFNYKVITIVNDITINDSDIIEWLYDNVQSGMPEIKDIYSNSDNFLTASLGYLHTITNYITTNTVLTVILIGLALVSIAVSLIARLNRKKFK